MVLTKYVTHKIYIYSLHNSNNLHKSYTKVNFLKYMKTRKIFSQFFVYIIIYFIIFSRYKKMTNKYYQKHKERLQKEARLKMSQDFNSVLFSSLYIAYVTKK